MFDRLLKGKFYSKCKSVIKVAKTRIDTIKRRRNAMQKFLKSDIVDLLQNGLDFYAYGKAEGLLIEMNLTSSYDFLQQSCECISNHLSAMNLNKECPEECREAVASLIFAAARFADLPELRKLRSIFTDRYGESLEPYVNKEFVEKLKFKHPTKDLKLQLIQDIAEDNGVEWDPKALEQKLYKPPPSEQDLSKNTDDDKNETDKSRDEYVHQVDKRDSKYKLRNVKDYSEKERNQDDFSSLKTASNEEVDDKKKNLDYKSIPPPYLIKPEVNTNETSSEASITSPKSNCHVGGQDSHLLDDESVQEAKPTPKSVRRRHRKSTSGHDDVDGTKGNMERKTDSSVNKQEEKQGLKMLTTNGNDQWDEEETEMDRLLEYYSTKQSPPLRHDGVDGGKATKQGHVHPKLPDYDDFVARLAALKGK